MHSTRELVAPEPKEALKRYIIVAILFVKSTTVGRDTSGDWNLGDNILVSPRKRWIDWNLGVGLSTPKFQAHNGVSSSATHAAGMTQVFSLMISRHYSKC